MIRLKNNNLSDYVLSVLCMGQLLLTLLQVCFISFNIFSDDTASKFRVVFSIVLTISALPFILKKRFITFFWTYIVVITIFGFSILMNKGNSIAIQDEALKFILPINIPIIFAAMQIKSIKIFTQVIRYTSYVVLALSVVYFIIFIRGELNFEYSYNMSLGYVLMLPALFFVCEKSFIHQIFILLLLLIMIFVGSRGPAIFVSLFMILGSFYPKRSLSFIIRKVGVYILFMLVLFISITMYISKFSLNSRTFEMILSGELISHDSGRSKLYSIILNAIYESPLIGYGALGDRLFFDGGYVHNFFLEVICDFGFLIGVPLIILFFLIIYKALLNNKYNRLCYLMFVFLGFLPLLVSSSFFINFNFALLLGISLNKNIFRV